MEGKLLFVLLFVASAVASEYPSNSPPEYPFRSPPVCNYKGEIYNVGQKLPAGDDCNTCTCRSGGQMSCTKKTCFCYAKGQKYKFTTTASNNTDCISIYSKIKRDCVRCSLFILKEFVIV
uniref:Pacifastin domain-containing protein n=1 Tax=Magallana gigas TaxID=29159 RepID=A0A8W8NSR0_MAGGI